MLVSGDRIEDSGVCIRAGDSLQDLFCVDAVLVPRGTFEVCEEPRIGQVVERRKVQPALHVHLTFTITVDRELLGGQPVPGFVW